MRLPPLFLLILRIYFADKIRRNYRLLSLPEIGKKNDAG